MGRRRRRKLIKVFRRRIPKIFMCPFCGKRAVTVRMRRDLGTAHVACGVCGASGDVQIPEGMSPVDAYCEWYDKVTSGSVGVEEAGAEASVKLTG